MVGKFSYCSFPSITVESEAKPDGKKEFIDGILNSSKTFLFGGKTLYKISPSDFLRF